MKVLIKKTLIAIVAIILIISGIFIGWFKYVTDIKVTDISKYTNPDNNYTVLFQAIGTPEWPFGKTNVKITLLDNKNKKVETVPTSINHDGASATEDNIHVQWFEDFVEIILYGSNQDEEIFRIDFNILLD